MPSQSILYEVDNLSHERGTGIATYARHLGETARRLGYRTDALFSVAKGLAPQYRQLNDILAFDTGQNVPPEPLWAAALRHLRYPFNALAGIKPVELARSGIVVRPPGHAFGDFERLFAATRLAEIATAHFDIYGRLAQVKLEQPPWLFHATRPLPIAVRNSLNIYTIHDLVPLRLPYTTSDDKKYFYNMLKALARTADHIVTVSEHSKRDIVEFLGVDERRVTNTYQAVDIPAALRDGPVDDVAEEINRLFGLEVGEYYLFCGAIEPKKNVSRLIDAYVASGVKRPLILAGSQGWQNQDEMRKIHDGRFVTYRLEGNAFVRNRQVRHLSYLPRQQLLHLIKGARALLFPSIYEGFGLPVVEAMLLGTPVVTSTASSLPEVAGEAALLVDPYSVDALRGAIVAMDADQDLRKDLIARGRKQAGKFSTDAYADRVRALYEAI